MPKKRLVVILENVSITRISKADVIRRVDRLSEHFETVIVSGSKDCRVLFPGKRVISIPRPANSFGGVFFMVACWLLLPLMKYDLLYVAEFGNVNACITLLKSRVLCYGNTHPAQNISKPGQESSHLMISRAGSVIQRFLLTRGAMKCSSIVAISDYLSSAYASLGITMEKLVVSGVGVPLESFDQSRRVERNNQSILNAVYIGSITRERGLDIVLRAVEQLALEGLNFKLHLVGLNMTHVDEIGVHTKNKGVDRILSIDPPIDYLQIPSVLADSNLGISLLEPTEYYRASPPIKVIEYLAAGLPVIANRIETHELYLEDGFNSVLVDYDVKSFCDGIRRLIVDQALRKTLTANVSKENPYLSDEGPIQVIVREAISLIQNS